MARLRSDLPSIVDQTGVNRASDPLRRGLDVGFGQTVQMNPNLIQSPVDAALGLLALLKAT